MKELHMGQGEKQFAEMIWEREPVSTVELVKLGEEHLDWKKTTCYTVLKRLCEKGIFQNDGGRVTSLISRQDFYAMQSRQFVDETFGGSLPAFLSAFTAKKNLTEEELTVLYQIIQKQKEE